MDCGGHVRADLFRSGSTCPKGINTCIPQDRTGTTTGLCRGLGGFIEGILFPEWRLLNTPNS